MAGGEKPLKISLITLPKEARASFEAPVANPKKPVSSEPRRAMRSADCRKTWNEIVDLAEGREAPAAEAHVANCADCAKRLADLRRMIRNTALEVHNAPANSISKAQAIFAPRKPVFLAGLSAIGAGARAVGEATQIRREVEGISVRLMIRPSGSDWQVLGQITGSSATELLFGDRTITIENGTFEFIADNIEEDIWLEEADRLVRIPLTAE